MQCSGGRGRALFRRFSTVTVNSKKYRIPQGPAVGICLDGSSQEYINRAIDAGKMPCWQKILTRYQGQSHALVTAAMPTFTNPNNVGIMTGEAPVTHGISGNFYFDQSSDSCVMMTSPDLLRCESIFSGMNQAGVFVGVLTAKAKLLPLLSTGLQSQNSIAAAIETLDTKNPMFSQLLPTTRPPPDIYNPDISIYLLELGVNLVRKFCGTPSVFYFSTTDYVQHKHAPGSEEANDFYNKIDSILGQLDLLGVPVGITADHGMNSKTGFDGTPKVVYLDTVLQSRNIKATTVLPITDPYVKHHGALGSYACVYVPNPTDIPLALEVIRSQPGVYQAIGKADAARSLQLPADRIGDIIVLGDVNTVLGHSPQHHDLREVSQLRSHGGLEEQVVPMFFNKPLSPAYKKILGRGKARNYQLFDLLLNGCV